MVHRRVRVRLRTVALLACGHEVVESIVGVLRKGEKMVNLNVLGERSLTVETFLIL